MEKIKKSANRVMFHSDNIQAITRFSELVKKRNPKNEFIMVPQIADILDQLYNPMLSKPDIIVLDIQLENSNVLKVVNQIKSSMLKYIPLLLIKKESDQNNILQFYSSYVNCFIMKPDETGKIFEVLKSIDDFWLEAVNLPKFQAV